jgi:hypothetical protein
MEKLNQHLVPSRRSFLGKAAAFSGLMAGPGPLWSLMRGQPSNTLIEPTETDLEWTRKKSPLMTRWSSLVDQKLPHPEYPRPQFVRTEWLNLNGLWQFQPGASADEAPPFGKTLARTILVPYPVESALSGVMELHDRLWYRRSFSVPAKWGGKRIHLHFGAVDYESEVFVNGQRVGEHRGGYDPFYYDITPHLKAGASNELIVRVFDPTESGGQPRGKQNTKPRGITYTPTTGIWQTVWLEPVSPVHISTMIVIPDIDRGVLNLSVDVPMSDQTIVLDVAVKAGQTVVSKSSGAADKAMAILIPNSKLWSPDEPFLYSLELTLKRGGSSVDSVHSYFAMRKSHVGDVDGQKKLLLNNQFVFQMGPLDQGFWPDGIYTAPTDDALKNDIVQMKAMGFNMVRKHIKVEPARWYYWADTLGLLVWQDMPSCNSYPGRAFTPPPEDKRSFEDDLCRMVTVLRNVPSIVLWTVFNEGQGQFDTERMVGLVRSLDSSRPINEASGGKIMGFGDINDIHSYPEPAAFPPNSKQANVCGEYGGIGYLIPAHSWQPDGHGYVEAATSDDLLYLYGEYMEWVRKLRDHHNLSAAVYTELTDVMTEVNGLLTYDRQPKAPVEKIKLVNEFQFRAPTYTAVMATSETQGQVWKYTLEQPQEGWSGRDFDDAHWSEGVAGFGNTGEHIRTTWTSPDVWLRRNFRAGAITPEQIESLVLTEFHQGRIEIYINGVQNFTQQGANRSSEGNYEHRPLSKAVRNAILPNAENVIAVHCHAINEKQSFDAGFSIRVPFRQ